MKIPSLNLFVLLGSLVSGLAGDLPLVTWQGRTMGSDYVVKIVDSGLDETKVNLLKAETEKALEQVNRQMSNYVPDSELSLFNKAPANAPFRISPEFAKVLRFGLDLSQLSDGAFDPTLGPLINLWGFGEKTKDHAVPTDELLRATRLKTGWRHLTLNGAGELIKDSPEIALDLGGIGKGYGVDQMIRTIQAHGCKNIYASIAGEVRVTGHNPKGTKWNLGISVPVDHWREDKPMAAMVAISNQALSTSGDYQKFFVNKDGKRFSHIIDGKSGTPVQHNLAAVTIVAPDSMTADGYSTTSFVLGTDAGMKFIETRPDAAALFIVREKDGKFRQIPSSRFEALTGYKP